MEENVKKFMYECVNNVANQATTEFIENVGEFEEGVFSDNEKPIDSPIEQMVFIALLTLMKRMNIPLQDVEDYGKYHLVNGILIKPQYKIGKYFVDFYINYTQIIGLPEGKPVIVQDKTIIVECDSQEWHERTEKERRYEKARDRYLTQKGYKVFHYTGREIIKKPFRVVKEILQEIIKPFHCDLSFIEK